MPHRTASTATRAPADGGLALVRSLVEPLCRAHGVDLVHVAWVTEHAGRTLRVTIERRDGATDLSTKGWGVTLADCAELSRDLSQAINHAGEDAIPGSYHLEVSSPGLERDLRGLEDFVRFSGMLARAKLGRPAPDGQRLLRGTIVGISGDAGAERLTMLVDKKEIAVPFADVVAANLVFEMTPQPPVPKQLGLKQGGARAGSSKRSQAKGSGS